MPKATKELQREYQLQWLLTRRRKWLQHNGPCVWCGSWIDLEVDHIDPNQKITHKVWSWSEEKRLAELAKCQVLCWQCHKRKTALDHFAKAKHGTYSMRNRYRCTCEACKEYVRRSKRESRARLDYN